MFHVLRYVPTSRVRNITESGSNARVAQKATRSSTQELQFFPCGSSLFVRTNIVREQILDKAACGVFKLRESIKLSLP